MYEQACYSDTGSTLLFWLPRSEAVSRNHFLQIFLSRCCHCFPFFLMLVLFKLLWVLDWIKLVQNGTDLYKMDQTCPKLIKLVQNWSNLSKLDQTCPKSIKLVQNRSRLYIWIKISKMDRTCSNLSKIDQTCPDLIKLVQNRSRLYNWIKLVQIGRYWSKMDQTCPKWI